MYLQFFGLQRLPFRLRADPDFLFLDQPRGRARADLLGAIRREVPLIVLSGASGLGKTSLLASVLGEIDAIRTVIQINQPRLSADEMKAAVTTHLVTAAHLRSPEVEGPDDGRARDAAATLRALGQPPLLVIENAHLLEQPALSLAAICNEWRSPMTTIMVGCSEGATPPAWGRLDLQTPLGVHIHLLPLSDQSVGAYIERRIAVAGAPDPALFSPDACRTIYAATGGAPRRINALCDAALSVACSRSLRHIGSAEVVGAMHTPQVRCLASEDSGRGDPAPAARAMATVSKIDSPLAAMAASEPTVVQIEKALEAEAAASQSMQPVDADVPPASVAALSGQPVRIQLKVSRGPVTLMTLLLKVGQLSIGRSPDNDIVLQSEYVSRNHCAVITVLIGEQLRTTVIDLDSINGLRVNGVATKRKILASGDVIRLGEFRLRYMEFHDTAEFEEQRRSKRRTPRRSPRR